MSIYSVLLMVIMNLDVSNTKFKTIVHAVAMNENRYQFSRRSIYTSEKDANSKNDKTVDGTYRLEKGFLGAHSDIGGGYANGDLSDVALMWMIKQAKEKGNININDNFILDNKFNQIDNPIVHDSVMALKYPVARLAFTPGSEFKWANDDSNGFGKHSIFNNVGHLDLNWNDTKVFQNPNHKKFDDIEAITRAYMLNPNARFAIYPGMLTDPTVLAMLQVYKYQKENASTKWHSKIPIVGTEDRNVLMAHETDKVIAINDYLHWLRCNYKIDLEYKPKKSDKDKSVEVPKSNLSNQQLCSGTPLQTYLKKK